jgi:ABC-type phosphonate transport system ATPase subunit
MGLRFVVHERLVEVVRGLCDGLAIAFTVTIHDNAVICVVLLANLGNIIQ